jgi:hypothetical protein
LCSWTREYIKSQAGDAYSISPIYDNYTSRACASDAHKVIEFFAIIFRALSCTYLLHYWGLNNEAISETKREKEAVGLSGVRARA